MMKSVILLFLGALASTSVTAFNLKEWKQNINLLPSLESVNNHYQTLTQLDLAKVKMPLGDRCEDQRKMFFQKYSNEQNIDGKMYNFKMVPLTQGEFRIAFVGDSITEGFGSTLDRKAQFSQKQMMTDNKLGYTNGQVNAYPSKLRQLLQDNNGTNKYSFMQYSYGDARLIQTSEKDEDVYSKSCRLEQLEKSLPHVVLTSIGYQDSLNPNFTMANYEQTLTSFVQNLQNLPSKPIVMLVVPPTTKGFAQEGKLCRGQNINDPYFSAYSPCSIDQRMDLQKLYYKVANQTGIPEHHVVNAFTLLRLNPYIAANQFFAKDGTHPNEKGQATMAQDVFMKMSLSPEIHARMEKVKNGDDGDWNSAVMAQIMSEQHQQFLNQRYG